MNTILILLSAIGLCMVWLIASIALLPVAIALAVLKQVARALVWVREFGA